MSLIGTRRENSPLAGGADREPDAGRRGDLAARDDAAADDDVGAAGDGRDGHVALGEAARETPGELAGAALDASEVAGGAGQVGGEAPVANPDRRPRRDPGGPGLTDPAALAAPVEGHPHGQLRGVARVGLDRHGLLARKLDRAAEHEPAAWRDVTRGEGFGGAGQQEREGADRSEATK